MSFGEKIIVIGDSHVRAFAFNRHFIPLFIGPAVFNNFLTDHSADQVKSKVAELLIRINQRGAKVLFLFSGDVEHTIRKSTGPSAEEIEYIKLAATRYTSIISDISHQFQKIRFLVSAVLPGGHELYKKYQDVYNQQVRIFCEKGNISFMDINSFIIDNSGLLRYPYKADFAHISYRVTPHYLKEAIAQKILEEEVGSYVSDYQWKDVINIETKNGPYKIWGAISRDELIIRDYEKLPLQDFQNRSKPASELMSLIIDFSSDYLSCHEFTVANCAEGFLAFESYYKNPSLKLNGFDLNLERIINASCLKALIGAPGIHFHNDYQDFDFQRVVVDFDQWRYKEDIRKQMLETYLKRSSYLFLLSYNLKSDERLLLKAGYQNIEIFPTEKLTLIVASNMDIQGPLDSHKKKLGLGDKKEGILKKIYRRSKAIIRS